MTSQDANNWALAINKIIANANPSAASAVLKSYYPTDVNSTPDQVTKALNILYASNPSKWLNAIKQIPVNVNNLSSQDQSYLTSIANKYGLVPVNAKLDLGSIWNSITGAIGGTSSSTGVVTQTNTAPAISATTLAIIVIIILAFLALLLYFTVFKTRAA